RPGRCAASATAVQVILLEGPFSAVLPDVFRLALADRLYPLRDGQLIEVAVGGAAHLAEEALGEAGEADVLLGGQAVGLADDGFIEAQCDLGVHGEEGDCTTKIIQRYV